MFVAVYVGQEYVLARTDRKQKLLITNKMQICFIVLMRKNKIYIVNTASVTTNLVYINYKSNKYLFGMFAAI